MTLREQFLLKLLLALMIFVLLLWGGGSLYASYSQTFESLKNCEKQYSQLLENEKVLEFSQDGLEALKDQKLGFIKHFFPEGTGLYAAAAYVQKLVSETGLGILEQNFEKLKKEIQIVLGGNLQEILLFLQKLQRGEKYLSLSYVSIKPKNGKIFELNIRLNYEEWPS